MKCEDLHQQEVFVISISSVLPCLCCLLLQCCLYYLISCRFSQLCGVGGKISNSDLFKISDSDSWLWLSKVSNSQLRPFQNFCLWTL